MWLISSLPIHLIAWRPRCFCRWGSSAHMLGRCLPASSAGSVWSCLVGTPSWTLAFSCSSFRFLRVRSRWRARIDLDPFGGSTPLPFALFSLEFCCSFGGAGLVFRLLAVLGIYSLLFGVTCSFSSWSALMFGIRCRQRHFVSQMCHMWRC